VYIWSDEWINETGEEEEMAECVGVPAGKFALSSLLYAGFIIVQVKFETRDVNWSPDGKGFILFDRDQFCCAFEVEDGQGES
jgi:hypothetical protein